MTARPGERYASTLVGDPVTPICADAGDDGFRFIFGPQGLVRYPDQGHLVTIAGRGGTGKSLLALQLVTNLLKQSMHKNAAAFYFTLEASPIELARQRSLFLGDLEAASIRAADDLAVFRCSDGLRIVSVPAPTENLTALILQIRQTIARELHEFDDLAAIVVDPLGGVTLGVDLRHELSQLKQLADSHATFLFLLAERHVYEPHGSIEHFSQTIIHLDHDPRNQPPRRLYIQKARSQGFRAGYHLFDLIPGWGARVFPSVQAQSAYAHEEREKQEEREQEDAEARRSTAPWPTERPKQTLLQLDQHKLEGAPGSVIFLMGPPGTFKQQVASRFYAQNHADSVIYISFKADIDAVREARPPKYLNEVRRYVRGYSREVRRYGTGSSHDLPRSSRGADVKSESSGADPATVWFLDARSPLSTPEEILSQIRDCISSERSIRRAVVWGLRRLADMPHFEGGKAVQFLEALVTLLKARQVTSLLVDWPDLGRASTLPIVDLTQYILLTRVCIGSDELKREEIPDDVIADVWPVDKSRAHVALVRIQRDARGYHRDQGVLYFKDKKNNMDVKSIDDFERLWVLTGRRWERDPSLGEGE